jgi:hypothetical protein
LSRGNADSIDAAAQSDVPQFVISKCLGHGINSLHSRAKIGIDGRAHGSGHAGNSRDFALSRNLEASAARICIRRGLSVVILSSEATKDLSSFYAKTEA